MKNKKQLIYLIIFSAVFLVAIVGATYAYFESATDLEGAEFNVQAITAGATTFTGYSTGTIEVEANSTSMTEANVSTNVVDQDNATVTVKVDSENDNALTTCIYDLVWVWDSDDIYTTPDIALPYTHIDNTVYPYELSVKIDDGEEKDLSSFTWNGKETVIANKSVTSSDGEYTYSIDVQIYNIPVVQTKLFNKHLQAHIEIRNNVCASIEIPIGYHETCDEEYAACQIAKHFQTQGTEVGDGKLYLHDITLKNSTEDNSYRYAGANPNNYVCFDGDDCSDEDNLYRIIGVFNNQIKVIKHKSIGGMSWNEKEDDSYTNTWENSTLEQFLNNTENGYLASLENKASLIADAIWSVGGSNTVFLTPKEIYDIETDMSTIVNRKIGLMYASDYGYATMNTNWEAKLTDSAIKITNWLYDISQYQWTILRLSNSTKAVFYLDPKYDVYSAITIVKNNVRPSFYFIPSVKIKKGSGTSTDPYVIGL